MSVLHKTTLALFPAVFCALACTAHAQLFKPVEALGSTGVNRVGADGDDDVASYVLTNTNFSFYGKTFKGLTVSTNGVVTYGDTGYVSFNPSNLPLPRGLYPGVWVAQDDWKQTGAGVNPQGYIYTKSYSDGLAITWANVIRSGKTSGPTNTFQAFLFNNGDIGIGYADLNDVNGYVVGINKGDGSNEYSSTTGLNTGQTAFNETGHASISNHQYIFHFDGVHYVVATVPAPGALMTMLLGASPGVCFALRRRRR